jgi:hypothetical protein
MAETETKPRKLHASRCQLAEQTRNVYTAVVESGTNLNHIQEPSFWAHVSGPKNIRPMDRIEVMPEDGSYWAELLVLNAGPMFAKVHLMRHYEIGEVGTAAVSDAFAVAWKGPMRQHAVIRVKDNAIMQDKFNSKEAALGWLAENAKNMAA